MKLNVCLIPLMFGLVYTSLSIYSIIFLGVFYFIKQKFGFDWAVYLNAVPYSIIVSIIIMRIKPPAKEQGESGN